MDNKKEEITKEEGKECCGMHHDHDDHDCDCQNEDNHSCNCDHEDYEEHEHHDTVTLELEDGSELICPIIDIFEVKEQEYIALLHPENETVLLYRFYDYEDGTIEITVLEDDAEYRLVSEAFVANQEEDLEEK